MWEVQSTLTNVQIPLGPDFLPDPKVRPLAVSHTIHVARPGAHSHTGAASPKYQSVAWAIYFMGNVSAVPSAAFRSRPNAHFL